jgi:hypothetical protein
MKIIDSEYLKMETERSSETFVNIYQATRRHISEGRILYSRRRENLKSPKLRIWKNFHTTMSMNGLKMYIHIELYDALKPVLRFQSVGKYTSIRGAHYP